VDNPRADGGLSVVTGPDQELYELVTQYVREEINRADRFKAAGEGRRSNTVGIAFTILLRRLASSPEAIWRWNAPAHAWNAPGKNSPRRVVGRHAQC
jgi:hypothetical protein